MSLLSLGTMVLNAPVTWQCGFEADHAAAWLRPAQAHAQTGVRQRDCIRSAAHGGLASFRACSLLRATAAAVAMAAAVAAAARGSE